MWTVIVEDGGRFFVEVNRSGILVMVQLLKLECITEGKINVKYSLLLASTACFVQTASDLKGDYCDLKLTSTLSMV